VSKALHLNGRLTAAEDRIREIAARVPGRIDGLHVALTGVPVRSGQRLLDLYSPALYSAQAELRQAVRTANELELSGRTAVRKSAARTVVAARERLRLWGLTPQQIARIEERGEPSDLLTINSPLTGIVLHRQAREGAYVQEGDHLFTIADLSVLWLLLDVYEADLAWLKLGQQVEFRTAAFPSETFTGTVSFIDPVLDERTRSLPVRVVVANEDLRLKPGLYARATVHAELGGESGDLPLVVPETAPLLTGKRAVVYVADPDDPGRFQGREVALGAAADGYFVIGSGLQEGELVVTNGAFKIDSALQIRAGISLMNPAGTGTSADHPEVPQEFRDRLDKVLAGYFGLRAALSRDDLPQAIATARRISALAQQVDAALLRATARDSWIEAGAMIADLATSLADAGDLAAARAFFFDLSQVMIDSVEQWGAGGGTPVLVFHCPMARDGAGADWLQTTTEVENPYYGAQMLRCGAQTATLVASPAARATTDHDHH
jgi:Cu(I)/Ag(I) efflux system membrane fusion protein